MKALQGDPGKQNQSKRLHLPAQSLCLNSKKNLTKKQNQNDRLLNSLKYS